LRTDITNIFGTASTRVRDMANAYATIAAGGKRATPYLISSVTSTSATSTIPEYKVSKVLVTVFDNKVTADVTDAMTRVVTEGTASKNTQGLDRPAAGKTGTSSENKAVWFDGFTPQLSTAVGIYQGTGQEKIGIENFGEVTGGTYPTEIWAAFMKDALQGQDVIPFPARVGVGDSALAPVPVPTTPKPTPTPSTTSTPVPSTTTPTPTFTRPRPTRTRPTGSPTQTSPPPTMTIPPTP
jgi:membrane peptidoglycan carboxypeptidase